MTVKTAKVLQLILRYSGKILKLNDRSYLSATFTAQIIFLYIKSFI